MPASSWAQPLGPFFCWKPIQHEGAPVGHCPTKWRRCSSGALLETKRKQSSYQFVSANFLFERRPDSNCGFLFRCAKCMTRCESTRPHLKMHFCTCQSIPVQARIMCRVHFAIGPLCGPLQWWSLFLLLNCVWLAQISTLMRLLCAQTGTIGPFGR